MTDTFPAPYTFFIQNLIMDVPIVVFFYGNRIMPAYALTRKTSHTHLVFGNLTLYLIFRNLLI